MAELYTFYGRVCNNGHLLGHMTKSKAVESDLSSLEQLPGPSFCPGCGEPALIRCPSCDKPLELRVPTENLIPALEDETITQLDYPHHCRFCGASFPWVNPVEEEEVREGDYLKIDSTDVNGLFYQELVAEINQCYRVQANEATYVLYRKLLESLTYDILSLYCDPAEEIELYYDTERGQKQNFSTLLESLKEKSGELDKFSDPVDDHEFHRQIADFKENGDNSAHSKENLVTDEDVEENSEEATHVAKVLFDLRRQITAGAPQE